MKRLGVWLFMGALLGIAYKVVRMEIDAWYSPHPESVIIFPLYAIGAILILRLFAWDARR